MREPAAGDAPAPGTVRAIAPGVLWARMPMPLALDHVNVWLLDDGDSWTVIDTGLPCEAARAAWDALFQGTLAGRPLRRVVCTHMHPDHVGLADWLCRRSGAELWMTQGEYLSALLLSAGVAPTDTASMLALFASHGAPADRTAALAQRGNFYARTVPVLPRAYRRIEAGQTLRLGGRDWLVIGGAGHSPEHAALWCEADGLLISGDMVLPRITTNVSVYPIEPEADALGRYLDSLAPFELLPEHALVLPSHGRPFGGRDGAGALHARIEQLRAHHVERLGRVREACRGTPRSAFELLPHLFSRPLDGHGLGFALGEAIAHANHLWARGDLERRVDAAGGIRFLTREAA